MKFSYDQPLVISSGPKPLSVTKVRHGVTQVSLSDGRIVRLSIHVEGVTRSAAQSDGVDVSYSIVTEVMAQPSVPIMDQHEPIQ